MTRSRVLAAGVIWLSFVATSTVAQDLDPRAYAQAPIGLTVAIAGVSVSSGAVLTDPTLPAEHVHADVLTPSVGMAQTFGLFGKTAQGLVALPYSSAQVTGDVGEQAQRVDRSGLSDTRFRLSVLLNRHAIKVGWSTGAFVRSGADFTTFSVGWQAGWLTQRPARKP